MISLTVDSSNDDGQDGGGSAGHDVVGCVAEILLTLAHLRSREVHGHVQVRDTGLTQHLRIHLLPVRGIYYAK